MIVLKSFNIFQNNIRMAAVPPAEGGQSVPPGLVAILSSLQSIYPSQRNPAQVTAVVKYWLGEFSSD